MIYPTKYYRELFALSDGEKIALDWHEEPIPTGEAAKNDKRPLLVCLAGLSGDNTDCYLTKTMQKANRMGYQAVFMSFRGAAGLPSQSGKMFSLVSWEEIKEASDYLYEKYVKKQGRRMYLYGVSYGANSQTMYLLNDNANTPYSGMVSYATFFHP